MGKAKLNQTHATDGDATQTPFIIINLFLPTRTHAHRHVHTRANVPEWLNLLALSIKGIRCSNTWCRSILLQLAWKADKTVSHEGGEEGRGARKKREKVMTGSDKNLS